MAYADMCSAQHGVVAAQHMAYADMCSAQHGVHGCSNNTWPMLTCVVDNMVYMGAATTHGLC